MGINDWLVLEEKYNFKFPGDFIPLYRELRQSDAFCGGLTILATPDQAEGWRNHRVDPDLLPILSMPAGDHICLRLPFAPDDPPMWIQRNYETNFRMSLGQSFAGVIRVLAAYWDAWSFASAADGEMEESEDFFRRSRLVLAEIPSLMELQERERLIRSRFWPLWHGNSPVTSNIDVVVPSFRTAEGLQWLGENFPKRAEKAFTAALGEDASFGTGHWALGAVHALRGHSAEACREWRSLIEGDLRTARPLADSTFARVHGGPPVANLLFAARYLRSHEAEYRSVSRNRAVASIILGEGFDTMGAWLEGLAHCMRDGRYAEAMPIAQSLLASYLDDQWFADDVEQFDACTNALATIYAAAGLECRVSGVAG